MVVTGNGESGFDSGGGAIFNNTLVEYLFDSGSDTSLVTKSYLKLSKKKIKIQN